MKETSEEKFRGISAAGLGLLRLLPAEWSHRWTLQLLRWLKIAGLLDGLLHPLATSKRRLLGLEFPNPLGLAAGLDKDARCLDALAALGVGFIELGTVTPRPCAGNPGKRLWRLADQRALLNRLGFPGLGMEVVATRLASFRRRNSEQIVGVNIGKQPDTPPQGAQADYRLLMQRFWPLCDYLTVNLSSPNSPGLRRMQEKEWLEPLLDQLSEEAGRLEQQHGCVRPLLVKFSPDMSEAQMEQAAALIGNSSVAGVILTNSTLGHEWPERGGLTGPPLAEKAMHSLRTFNRLLPAELVRVACGGIDSGAEALERCRAGANLVQLYTGLVYRGPALLGEIADALANAELPLEAGEESGS